MSDEAIPAEKRRLILSFARPDAYVPMARAILGRMGYAIVSPEEWKESETLAGRSPQLAIVEDRRLAELPAGPPFASLPLILLSAKGVPPVGDRRAVGAIVRPAGLHGLYRLLQQVLETTARSSMRVPTNLPVRLRHGGRESHGSVLSLSENGCLVRTPEPMRMIFIHGLNNIPRRRRSQDPVGDGGYYRSENRSFSPFSTQPSAPHSV